MQPKDMLARMGGDVFAVLLTDQTERESLTRLAERAIDAVGQPYRLGTKEVHLSCSVGIALYPDHGDAERLIARAETAVQTAKRAGARASASSQPRWTRTCRRTWSCCAISARRWTATAWSWCSSRRSTPPRSHHRGRALLRWKHAQRGDVPPTVFVALAERFGLVCGSATG
jgi:predicted signal transduction protein with EAL and GGDEF domain